MVFSLALSVSAVVAKEPINPSYFSSPDSFFISSVDWDLEKFAIKWAAYPTYLKLDAFLTATSNSISNHYYQEFLRKIAVVESDEFKGDRVIAENERKSIEKRIREALPRNDEKLNLVKEKYELEKSQGKMSQERKAQFLHYAFSFYCPIGGEIHKITEIFGEPKTGPDGNKIYFFGNDSGGYRFEIIYDKSVVTRIRFSAF